MGPETLFRRVINETGHLVLDKKVRRVVLCSGKVYYDLLRARLEAGIDDVALIRVEQFYPWPRQSVLQQLARYPSAEVLWCQEEPANMGGWTFVYPRLENILDELGKNPSRPVFTGRKTAASPATGIAKVHHEEQARLVEEALTAEVDVILQPFRRDPA
jgi:2-oxoglutarate dehydrogenase E1 component